MKTSFPCSLVDPFWGNGVVNSLPLPLGMARGWNWLKAQTGNTHPGAQLPFGWVSACPYSGAYPTGYGQNGVSFNGPGPKMFDKKTAWGVTHFHPSGTGFVGFFYNYFLCMPSSKNTDTGLASDLVNEVATPGFYSGTLKDYGVDFALTSTNFAALHRYHFLRGQGHLAIILTSVGLRIGNGYSEEIRAYDAAQDDSGNWKGYIDTVGPRIWFSAILNGEVTSTDFQNGTIEYGIASADAELVLGFSLVSQENAVKHALEAADKGLEALRQEADTAWANLLGRIRPTFTLPELQRRFYSCLYHSFVKPVRYDGGYIDFMTMWDIYRTQLPLSLTLSREHARPMLLSMLETIERLGFFPIFYFMHDSLNCESNQATALVVYTLCDGFMRGLLAKDDYPRIKKDLQAEFAHANLQGKSPTHTLDLAGAYHAASLIAQDCGDVEYAKHLQQQSNVWKQVYNPNTGYLVKDAVYYEGNYRNYSFRAHTGMKQRIDLAGGTQRFCDMLDDFFTVGYDKENAEARPIREGYFEAMNNESDMETPFTYLWCGRTDRMAEINDIIRRYQFTDGEGGAPGNVDSGALSSWYVWSCIGLYPLTGTQYYLLGSPSVSQADIDMTAGTLHISVNRKSPDSIYPVGYSFNGRNFTEPWMPVAELEKGGTLVFTLDTKPIASPIPDWL